MNTLLAAGSALIVSTVALGVQERPQGPPVGKGPNSQTQTDGEQQRFVQDLAAAVMPLVEQAAARKFTAAPKIVVGAPEALQAAMEEEVRQTLRRLYPNAKPEHVEQDVAASGIRSDGYVVKYAPTTKAVYVLPERIESILQSLKLDNPGTEPLLRILLAHELAHALQDQEVGLAQLTAAADQQTENVGRMIVEGHAMWTHRKVTERLDLSAARKPAEMVLALQWKPSWDKPIFDVLAYRGIFLSGFKFMEHHAAIGGAERLWKTLQSPPRTTAEVVQPATFKLPGEE